MPTASPPGCRGAAFRRPGRNDATHCSMTDEERALLVDYLAYNPTSGDLIPGTGGVRKLRWGLPGRGKRGGARVV